MPVDYTFVSPEAPEPTYDLSVITVCRNDFVGLQATVHSVLRQKANGTLRIEHVVVDGLSEDATPRWLQEQHEIGNIEVFVSEPDRGIYDAMNKGINLAHGKVLAFLNAADTYSEEDLRSCISPILDGLTQHTMASAAIIAPNTGKQIGIHRYDSNAILMVTPGCHQAYFAAAAAYRALGGYQAQQFRCCADGVFMNSLTVASAEPTAIPRLIAHYADGGFSAGCGITFVEEFIDLQWMFHRQAMERAAKNRAYARALALHTLRQYRYLALKGAPESETLFTAEKKLRSMTADIAIIPIGRVPQRLLHRMKELSAAVAQSAEARKRLNRLATGRKSRFCERYLMQQHPSYSLALLRELGSILLQPLRYLRRTLLNIPQ